MNYYLTVDGSQGRREEGVYTLEGETLTVWYSLIPGGEQPREVPAPKDDRFTRDTWKRVGRSQAQSLDGEWKRTSHRIHSSEMSMELDQGTMTVDAGRYVRKLRKILKSDLKVDETKEPRSIDLTSHPDALGAGRLTPGIYRLDGDRLTICIDGKRAARPTAFGTSKDNGDLRMLYELKRIKLR